LNIVSIFRTVQQTASGIRMDLERRKHST